MSANEHITFGKFIEEALEPSRGDYSAAKFEHFIKETRNVSCPGCGEVGLYEYEIIDPIGGIMMCPKCFQRVDLKTMMKAWIGKHWNAVDGN